MSHSATSDANGPTPTLLSLLEAARLIGGYCWTETRLFEALGGWATTVPDLDAKLMFGRHAHHHAWHAQLWDERLPELRELSRHELTAPPDAAFERFVSAVTDVDASHDALDRLVGVYRVLVPHCIVAYRAHRERASEVADAPAIRTLTLVLRDLRDDWAEGETVIQAKLVDSEAVERAAQRQARLEMLHLASTGLTRAGAGSG